MRIKNVINCTLINSGVGLRKLAQNDHLEQRRCRKFKILLLCLLAFR